MHSGVRNIHRISQNRLKGTPNTVGWRRSHQETVKQTAIKGINPYRSAPREGRGTGSRVEVFMFMVRTPDRKNPLSKPEPPGAALRSPSRPSAKSHRAN